MLVKIETQLAPSAVELYSQAIVSGNLIFVSGQLGIDPASGELPEDFETQAKNALNNIKAILDKAGASLEQTLKVTIFLDDMANYAKTNEIYNQYFTNHKPARSCVQAAALPLDGKIEIELIAAK